jgi:hypothetical protein
MPCDKCPEPASCILAGIIVGIILIIFLSGCGFVNVPTPKSVQAEHCEARVEHCESRAENLNIRPVGDPMKQFRGDAKPPVVMGDPFVLSMQTGSSGVSPY